MTLAPTGLTKNPAYEPLAALLADQLLTADTLAGRWGYTSHHMATLRRQQREPAWVELPTGGIRYRLSHVAALELAGQRGPITIEQVALAISATPGVNDAAKASVLAHVRAALAF